VGPGSGCGALGDRAQDVGALGDRAQEEGALGSAGIGGRGSATPAGHGELFVLNTIN